MNRRTIGALTLSGALALGACGSATTAEPGAGPDATSSTSAPAEAEGASAKVGDVVDLKELSVLSAAAVEAKGTAHLTQETAGEGALEGQVDYSQPSPRLAMSIEDADGPFRMILVDATLYLGGPDAADADPEKPWLKLDPTANDEFSAMFAPLVAEMESAMANPAEALAADVVREGTVTAVDVDSTTYQVVLTKAQLEQTLKAATKGLPGITETSVATLPETLTYTFSLTRDHLPLVVVVDLPDGAVTTTYSKWGEPVDIEAPPAELVDTPTA